MPVALRGSREALVHQNIIADVEGLSRIQDNTELSSMVEAGYLVPLPASSGIDIDSRLPHIRRYCRPWTAKFLSDISHAHERAFGRPLHLTSAVRTVSFQRHLARYNGNAAPTSGDTASPHLTGQAIDIGKRGMSRHEIAWMRTVLAHLQSKGKLDVEEEFKQACFHISVYKTYIPHQEPVERLIASNEAQASSSPTEDTAETEAQTAEVRPVSEHVGRKSEVRRSRSSSARKARRTTTRHHRSHREAMSLLAAGMR